MFSITKVDDKVNSYHYREYLLDTEDDVAKLPTSTKRGTQIADGSSDAIMNDTCGINSKAFVVSTATMYVLGNDDQWHKIETNNVGSSSSPNGSGNAQTDGGLIVNSYIDNETKHLKFVLTNGVELDAGLINVMPEVTEEDNGKIMMVVDGRWTLVNGKEETLTIEAEDTSGNYYSRSL